MFKKNNKLKMILLGILSATLVQIYLYDNITIVIYY